VHTKHIKTTNFEVTYTLQNKQNTTLETKLGHWEIQITHPTKIFKKLSCKLDSKFQQNVKLLQKHT